MELNEAQVLISDLKTTIKHGFYSLKKNHKELFNEQIPEERLDAYHQKFSVLEDKILAKINRLVDEFDLKKKKKTLDNNKLLDQIEHEGQMQLKQLKFRSLTNSLLLKSSTSPLSPNQRLEKIIYLQRLYRKSRRFKKWTSLVSLYKNSDASRSSRLRYEKQQEIIETERTYVNNLNILVEIFMKSLETAVKQAKVDISQEDINSIFTNIKIILSFNTTFLKDLELQYTQYPHLPIQLGSMFLRMVPFFKAYTQFVNDYVNIITLVHKCRSKKSFEMWLKETEEKVGNTFSSFLILPIQRVPRYVLLLQELTSYTPESHLDYFNLNAALVKTREVAEYLNKCKRDAENRAKVVEVNNKVLGHPPDLNIVEPHRYLVREGTIEIQISIDSYQPRQFYLFNDLFLFCTNSQQKSSWQLRSGLRYDSHYFLGGANLEDGPRNSFKLLLPNKVQLSLACSSEETKADVMRDITQQIAHLLHQNQIVKPLDVDPDLTLSNQIIRQGYLYRLSGSAPSKCWIDCWFVLREGTLRYYSSQEDAEKKREDALVGKLFLNDYRLLRIYVKSQLSYFRFIYCASSLPSSPVAHGPGSPGRARLLAVTQLDVASPSQDVVDGWFQDLRTFTLSAKDEVVESSTFVEYPIANGLSSPKSSTPGPLRSAASMPVVFDSCAPMRAELL
eukprot:TRINITY_DN4886_c0_g1_i1.p1 TRINITY_DN4886_c0_g1~~TRINITY_DN4886_c0_g1_i1.p1  ORF type:complete len:674 (-),score=136.66 TRINITY_DN4886_c0_g1_i1:212-2233(-)